MANQGKYNHLRYSRSEMKHDDRESWTLSNINVGNYLHHHNDSFRSNSKKERSIVDRENNGIPFLKIYEIQPDNFRNLGQYLEVVKKQFFKTIGHLTLLGGEAVKKHGPKLIAVMKALGAGKSIEEVGKIALQDQSKTTSENDTNSYKDSLLRDLLVSRKNYDSLVFKEPIEEYTSFFDGRYIRSYELPYTEETYFYANGNSGWGTIGTSDINFGNKSLNALFKTATSLNVADTPLVPNWVAGKDASNYYNVTTKFYLVNSNTSTLTNNLMFLTQLMQGGMWVQYDSFHVPPNIYSVEIPGFIFVRYASMFVSVKHVGNRRMITDNLTLYAKTGLEMFNGDKLKNDIFFPDAWEIEITFKSLVPNNFNTFMNYLQYGTASGETEGSFNNTIKVGSKLKKGKIVDAEPPVAPITQPSVNLDGSFTKGMNDGRR